VFGVEPGEENARAFRDGVDERRGFGWSAAIERPGDADLAHSARQGDIGEPTLFVDVAIARGDDAGLEGGQEDVRKLEPLGFVQGHQIDHVFIPIPFAVRRQRRLIQEFPRAVEAAGDVEQFPEIFEPLLHILRPALA
jgi:hypothetical protein